ncbi:MAG: thioredoxin [Lentisphaerales bacterium]|nr:MAG: thioredoxin [Lentisphaerales bacterium]
MSGKPITITNDNWEQDVIKAEGPVLVDFWAEWCGPCKAIAPTVESLADELDGKIKVAKVNVDDNPQLAVQFGIRSIPTLLIFKGGEVKEQIVGALSKDALKSKLTPHLA